MCLQHIKPNTFIISDEKNVSSPDVLSKKMQQCKVLFTNKCVSFETGPRCFKNMIN